MSKIEEIGIENIIKAMNEHYKKFGRDEKFIRMEDVVINSNEPKYIYDISNAVNGIDMDKFSKSMSKYFNIWSSSYDYFEFVEKFLALENANHSYFVPEVLITHSAEKLAFAVNNIKGVDIDYIVSREIENKNPQILYYLARELPEKRQELANAFLEIDSNRSSIYDSFVEYFAHFAKLENIDIKPFEDKFYYTVENRPELDHAEFVKKLASLKEIDIDRLSNFCLSRKACEKIALLNSLYWFDQTIVSNNGLKEKLLLSIFSKPLCQYDYKYLYLNFSNIEFLINKALKNPCEESCTIASNLIEIYNSKLATTQKSSLKDLIINNSQNPLNLLTCAKFIPEFQTEYEDTIINLMRNNPQSEKTFHSFVEISRLSKHQDKMVDSMLEMVNEGLSIYTLLALASNVKTDTSKISKSLAKNGTYIQICDWLTYYKHKQSDIDYIYKNASTKWSQEEKERFKSKFQVTPEDEQQSPLDDIFSDLAK